MSRSPDSPSVSHGTPQRLLVVGLGNPMRGDDSVGIECIHALRNQAALECELLELSRPGLDLFDLLDRDQEILFIDAVVSGTEPGTIHLVPLPSSELASRNMAFVSCHGFGLLESIEIRRALGRPLAKTLLLGIEIESVMPGVARSARVEQAMQAVLLKFGDLRRHLAEPESALWKAPHRFDPGSFALVLLSETRSPHTNHSAA